MAHDVKKTIALIERTPKVLNDLLRDLPDDWTMRNEGEKSWSAFDIVGHLIHGEKTDWIPRAKRIMEAGESKQFDKFDRLAQERDSQGKTLPQLLDEFTRLRAENLKVLRAWQLKPSDLERRGKHPELGSCTLSQLLATWVV